MNWSELDGYLRPEKSLQFLGDAINLEAAFRAASLKKL